MNDLKANLIINDKTYSVTLYDNETVKELITAFPLTLTMSDLNDNEKYSYLSFSLPTNVYVPEKITKGDIKLYNDNCLVIFYQDFASSYAYTDIGKIDNPDEFIKELNESKITVTLELI